jgi:divergent AAA domain protein
MALPPRNNQCLNDLFVLDGIVNVNARDRILREIVSNTLAHRDYSSGYPALQR